MKRTTQVLRLVVALCFTLVFTAVGSAATYDKIVEVFDWGAATPVIILNLDEVVNADDLPWNAFEVHVRREDPRLDEPFLEEGERRISDMYVVDDLGNRAQVGSRIAIELEVHPAVSLGSELNYRGFNDWIKADYTITQVKDIGSLSGLVITELRNVTKPQIDVFNFGSHTYLDPNEGEITLTYASYEPELDGSGKKPLIIWLHGGGEGGTDPTIPLAANKAVEFAAPSVQDIFGGAYVLVPQTPTRWMEPGYNDGDDGHSKGNTGRVLPKTSKYTASLMSLIEEYVKANIGVDRNRIYIGGASNGGFMTTVMQLTYPDYFAAYFPVCGAMTPGFLFDHEIDLLATQNIWFVVSAEDRTLPAPQFTVGLYDLVRKAGSTTAHLSYLPHVIDESGLYLQEDGSPHKYDGHWSWIYVYNNDIYTIIDGRPVTFMHWLAEQRR